MSQETNQQAVPGDANVAAPETDALLEGLQNVIAHLQRLIDCRSHESLQQPGHDGHWGVVEILCYLRDWETVIHERIHRMIDEEVPRFAEPDTTMWPLDHEYGSQDSHEVFQDLTDLRGSLIGQLRGMDANLWARSGIFEASGEMTLREYLQEVVAHDQHYVDEAREAVT